MEAQTSIYSYEMFVLLEELHQERFTGTATINADGGQTVLYLGKGVVRYARTTRVLSAFPAYLLTERIFSKPVVKQFLKDCTKEGVSLEQHLLQQKKLSPEDLRHLKRDLARSIFSRTFCVQGAIEIKRAHMRSPEYRQPPLDPFDAMFRCIAEHPDRRAMSRALEEYGDQKLRRGPDFFQLLPLFRQHFGRSQLVALLDRTPTIDEVREAMGQKGAVLAEVFAMHLSGMAYFETEQPRSSRMLRVRRVTDTRPPERRSTAASGPRADAASEQAGGVDDDDSFDRLTPGPATPAPVTPGPVTPAPAALPPATPPPVTPAPARKEDTFTGLPDDSVPPPLPEDVDAILAAAPTSPKRTAQDTDPGLGAVRPERMRAPRAGMPERTGPASLDTNPGIDGVPKLKLRDILVGEKLIGEADKLAKADYYAFFGISPRATFGDVRAAYLMKWAEYATEAFEEYELTEEATSALDTIHEHIEEGYETLTDLDRRCKHNERFELADASPREELEKYFEAEDLFQEAQDKLGEGDNDSALALIMRATELNPAEPEYTSYLAWTLTCAVMYGKPAPKELPSPSELLDQALRADPKLESAWVFKARIAEHAGEHKRALAAYTRAAQANPDNAEAVDAIERLQAAGVVLDPPRKTSIQDRLRITGQPPSE